MLSPAMRLRSLSIALALLGAVALAGTLAACGEEEETEVAEGEPIEVADLAYNVGLTRFLNPDDPEDAEYLVGQPTAQPGTAYLGVFLTVENETEIERPTATDFTVTDTLDTEYDPLESESPYALDVGIKVPAEDQLPIADTTAESGPNAGNLLIFLVDDTVSDNRPLLLEIRSYAGTGDVILDI